MSVDFEKLLIKVFGTSNERAVKKLWPAAASIGALEEETKALSDEQLRAKTAGFRARIAAKLEGITGDEERKAAEQEALDELLPEAFAVVREAGWRTVRMRHFDVQLIGGMVLHKGKIAEMKTGEGKTLVATLACYLNALLGRGVHVVTVNDYLAKRDAEWMGKIYEFLGLTVGVIVHDLSDDERRAAYGADITYGTNNEFGFDYLRDNMKFELKDCVQRGHYYCIVDEVDSILIDEARTPLIISGPTDQTTDKYQRVRQIIPQLQLGEEVEWSDHRRQAELGIRLNEGEKYFSGDYVVDEKNRTIGVTDEGWITIEKALGISNIADAENWELKHYVETAIKAEALYKRDVDYVVKDGEVIIVDTFTGRLMPGRRWSDGLHQSIEAKEGVSIRKEDQTLATITFQNYFRLYQKLSGMTGTAETEAAEFENIYKLEIVVIPTNKPLLRVENADMVFRTEKEKYKAVADNIAELHEQRQPVLVGTTSIEKSERLSAILARKGIRHVVLNAKFHEREAEIVAQAGRLGMVTIATNMAGRGTDIVLGGSLEVELKAMPPQTTEEQRAAVRQEWQQRHDAVVASGGLHIIGSERHESRRIDNQLRGRSGRQGDPGSSRFYLALDDNLMRIFAGDRVKAIMERFGVQGDEAIEHPWVTKAIENAQRKVEAHNFDIRKQLLEYDDVANDQRKVIYEQRNELLQATEVVATIHAIFSDVINSVINEYIPPQSVEEQWNIQGLVEALEREFTLKLDIQGWLDSDNTLHEETLRSKIVDAFMTAYQEKEQQTGAEVMRQFEKAVMLQVLDNLWREHLANMDYLRQGIHLRSYAQVNPKQAYKHESFEMFAGMLDRFKLEVVGMLAKVQVRTQEDVQVAEEQRRRIRAMQFQHAEAPSATTGEVAGEAQPPPPPPVATFVREGRKVGRNEPCPCGSGLKYKQCHGRLS